MGIPVAKIDLEKTKKTKEKIVIQNDSMCTRIKIESFFWLFMLKKDRRTSSLVIKINDAKKANMLFGEGLVPDQTLHRCMRYNPIYKIKQYFNYYEYGHVLVYHQKSTKCGTYLGSHKTSKCLQNKAQKCSLYNNTHTLWDKQCEHQKKKYLRIEAAKQNTLRLHEVRSKINFPKRDSSKDMRLLPRP